MVEALKALKAAQTRAKKTTVAKAEEVGSCSVLSPHTPPLPIHLTRHPLAQVWKANAKTQAGQATVIGWGAVFAIGLAAKGVRQAVEALDVFVGRYLLLTTVGYVGIKFIHFKIFDPIPF